MIAVMKWKSGIRMIGKMNIHADLNSQRRYRKVVIFGATGGIGSALAKALESGKIKSGDTILLLGTAAGLSLHGV